MTTRVPIKHLFDVSRSMFMPSDYGSKPLFHYSLPAWHEHGDGIIESASDLASGKLLLKGGEVLVSKLNPEKSAVVLAETHEIPTVCSPEFIALVPKKIHRKFAYYFMLAEPLRYQLNASVESVTNSHKRARVDRFLASYVDLPDQSTQREIADFLDRETARIDLLIEKKQKLVVLLGEKQSALTERLVAFGPDYAVTTIRTPSVWVPEVAEGVELVPIKRVARLINGYAFCSDDLGENGVPVIRIGDVGAEIDTEAAKKFTGNPTRNLNQFVIRNGDILIAMTGATIGKFGVYLGEKPAYLNQRVGILRSHSINRRFLSNCLGTRTFVEQMKLFAYGGAQPNIGSGEIGSIIIPVPSPEVQIVVADIIGRETAKLTSTRDIITRSVDRLKEYRSALITAAVTGQIDVTTYAKSGATDRRLDAIQEEMGA